MTQHFHDRHEGLFDPITLEQKRVLVVGAGSVGSVLAMLLVRSGVKHLTIFDFDAVSPSNLCRTVYRYGDIGRPKVEALAELLGDVRPEVEVDAQNVDLRVLDDDALVERIEDVDLVVAVTDHPPTQLRLGALSYHLKPTVFSGIYARGTGGEVLFTIPNETPCYSCVMGSVRGGSGPERGRTEYGIATGQLASEPALGIDITHVTSCAAKIALGLLLRGTAAPAASVIDPRRNVLFVGNSVDWIWKTPLENLWARAVRLDDCICRLEPGASTADLID